jgi:CHAD domain-containing protein
MLQGLEAGDPRALHRIRVASRRLREVLPVLQLDPELSQKLSRRLRAITAHLGTVRELDVLRGVIAELEDVDRYPRPALARVAAHLGDDHVRARARLMKKVPLAELRRVAVKLKKVLATLGSTEAQATLPDRATSSRSWRWAIDARVARRAGRLAEALAGAGAMYLPERLHAVRIAVKKLRYSLELSAHAANLTSTPELKQLRHAQDVLGRLHDLQVLIDRTREAQAALMPPDLIAWRQLDMLVLALEEDCRRLHARYMHDRAALEALCSRLSGRASGGRKIEKVRAR